jgi:hypothetical protein
VNIDDNLNTPAVVFYQTKYNDESEKTGFSVEMM